MEPIDTSDKPITSMALAARLQQAGLIPPGCRDWSMHMPLEGVVLIKTECFLSVAQGEKLATILLDFELHEKDANCVTSYRA